MNTKLMEYFFPSIIGLISAIVFYRYSSIELNSNFSQSVSTLSGMLVGFSGTILALITALNTELLNELRQSGYLRNVTTCIIENVISSIILTIACIASLVITYSDVFISIVIFLIVHCIVSFLRNMIILYLLINTNPEDLT